MQSGGKPAVIDDTTDEVALRGLVGRAASRDPAAWEALYRRSYGRLFGYARRRLFDDQSAEDAVSETMTRALDSIDRFTWRGAGFDAWLYGIARNVVHELSRARWRQAGGDVGERPTTDRGPEEHAVAGDAAACMREAFALLSSDDQDVLELRVQAGFSAEQVGSILGRQPGAIRMAQSRALQRLRANLEVVGGVH